MPPNATRERVDAFLDHSRSFEGLRYVYPVVSRRSGGLSVGINLNPDKRCNFDCVYCQVDRATPPAVLSVDLDVLSAELEAVVARVADGRIWAHPRLAGTPERLRRLNDIALSGDGEPTTERRFAEAVQIAADLLSRCDLPSVQIVLITDAACLHHERVIRGLDIMEAAGGVIWAKLDAGTVELYEQVNRTMVPFSRVLTNLATAARSYRVVIQSLFFAAHGDPPGADAVDAYVDRLVEIESEGTIEEVHVYTIARAPAEPWCTPLTDHQVDTIVDAVRARVRAPVRGFYGPAES
jgi:wyosine [tRNA(Phe)-imidazoG37] synthetase (radical SAM superfamily)